MEVYEELRIQFVNFSAMFINEIFTKYRNQLSFHNRSNMKILNIGCNYGIFFVHDLLLLLPQHIKLIITVDTSYVALDSARKQLNDNNDRRIVVAIMDIERDVVKEHHATYDYVMSFWALHQVKCHSAAFRNMHKLLKIDGYILLVFMVNSVIYNILKTLHEAKLFIGDNYVTTPFGITSESEEEIKSMFDAALIEAGFTDIEIKLVKKTYVFTNYETFKDYFLTVYMRNLTIPDTMEDAFYKKFYHELMMTGNIVKDVRPNRIMIKVPVEEITLIGKKSSASSDHV